MKTYKILSLMILAFFAKWIHLNCFDLPFDDQKFHREAWIKNDDFYQMSLDLSKNILPEKVGCSKEEIMTLVKRVGIHGKEEIKKPSEKALYFSSMKNDTYGNIKSYFAVDLYESILLRVNYSIIIFCFSADNKFIGSFILCE